MTQEHPITPPTELFKQWEDDILNERDNVDHVLDCAWRNGFQAGADQELEACCEWLRSSLPGYDKHYADYLHAARRPKPPSLKEQAKFAAAVLRSPDETCSIAELQQHWHTICKALEQLND